MAEVTKARTGQLIRKLFGILQARPDGMKAAEALLTLAAQIEMTPYEADGYPADLEARHYTPRDDGAHRLSLKPMWFMVGEHREKPGGLAAAIQRH